MGIYKGVSKSPTELRREADDDGVEFAVLANELDPLDVAVAGVLGVCGVVVVGKRGASSGELSKCVVCDGQLEMASRACSDCSNHITHDMQHAGHNTQHETHNMQHATRNTQHATRNTQHTSHNV